MSETKHTQREWFVDGYWVREREPYDEAGHQRGICKIMSARSRYGEAATNARLIAAAPTMLETLKRISMGLTLPEDDVQKAIRKVADEAIALAVEGQ
jgi:hypothetical protein